MKKIKYDIAADFELEAEAERGATIFTAYAKREMKAYPVLEAELDSISFFNTMTLVFSSVGAALFSFAVGILTNAAFAEKLTPQAEVLSTVGCGILIFLAVVSFLVAGGSFFRKQGHWNRIKRETE